MKAIYDAYGIMEYLINQICLPMTLQHCTRLQTANIQYYILSYRGAYQNVEGQLGGIVKNIKFTKFHTYNLAKHE